ncbi:Caspase domain-containing protein [Granulicella rosea]|uniref:Caspase domain-containing protein n=1 Tax=Granulicella rosea TaxID=474952 RepID=A0A239EAS8_9BACT|nr:caspase family protein [Granulicella rosea]SNS41014.1 Caspase domain-containing protein [Granulicella rosea]
MPFENDPALIYLNSERQPGDAGTHVFIVGVGKYRYGQGQDAMAMHGQALSQLTSPPHSARAMADWFLQHFRRHDKPLTSLAMVLSEENPQGYTLPGRPELGAQAIPAATLENVEAAADRWAMRLESNPANMAVFYFCGHGIANGMNAAALLEDFGRPQRPLTPAIDLMASIAVMKNSTAREQAFFIDACRSDADDLYTNQSAIGQKLVEIVMNPAMGRRPVKQFSLFPSIRGHLAYARPNQPSVFCRSLLDAFNFAAADDRSLPGWKTRMATILDATTKLMELRVPADARDVSTPNAMNAVSFDFNEIDPPVMVHSFVSLSDHAYWQDVTVECAPDKYSAATHFRTGHETLPECYCCFPLPEGQWNIRATGLAPERRVEERDWSLRAPVVYIELEVTP